VADFKLTPQDTISYLQEFIDSINKEMDAILGGENYRRHIDSLRLRVELLCRVEGNPFEERINSLKEELKKVEDEFKKVNPHLEKLEAERRYYRTLLNEINR
jgi:polyhydroxyalkanoate synthesis regulator phasin